MNLILKAIYVCRTNEGYWGKGYTIAEAKKKANFKTKCKYHINAALFDNPSPEELKNLFSCITVNGAGELQYYQDNRTEKDTKIIGEKHVGWLTVESNYK